MVKVNGLKNLGRLLCKLNLHRWEYRDNGSIRRCKRCYKLQACYEGYDGIEVHNYWKDISDNEILDML